MDGKVTISIVTYNSQHIFKVLDHLQQTLGVDSVYEIHIFDNHSELAYRERLATYQPFITLHVAEHNAGFGHGHNYILEKTAAQQAIIFNPDVLVNKTDLDRLVERLRADAQLAMVAPRVLNEDGSPQYLVRERLTVFDYMLRFVPFTFVKRLFDRRLHRYECRDLPEDQTSFIRMGSGCLMVVDVTKFKAVGGFDERFFMYFEDNDLCLSFEQAGYRILYSPFETVTHIYEKGAHKSWALFKIFMQSMAKFFNKWGWRLF